ncbi:phospholipid/cholesterol/gamma-HCH transport system permease protein [Panacagrimonas perspica]|uniref:Intermembrane phospholipid transport system permease protein MlaE n=1 Tax=Panacagrimonas perspica TaxID=381431 RepID=A0A4R7P0N5_9GAMM|nr:lipid asymmetry maintenance ABC transporter permease subunit MlaE [Panacagrimonas perspica]TDU26832.1 phospholipid/cholesterol/gamma-HCH transport system permease protein [Panacagrimonas perspica]THD03607.1 ABC transporter permease [Panacagrimonas perspica]
MSGAFSIIQNFLSGLGRAQFFLLQVLGAIPALLLRPRLIVQQLYYVGQLSMVIIVLAGSFVGMVLALQGYRTLIRFGAEESLGVFVALVIVRELGPVVTALLFAGRAGSALAAELGLMRATDQLSAMEMMAVDPIRRVVAPRFLAGVIAMPLLASVFAVMAIGIAGGHAIGVELLGVDAGSYWSQIRGSVGMDDITDGLVKATVFGVAITWIAVYQGFNAEPTSEGVSRATTSTVVISSLSILALDFVLTAFMFK